MYRVWMELDFPTSWWRWWWEEGVVISWVVEILLLLVFNRKWNIIGLAPTLVHQSPPLPNLPKPYLILWQIDVLCRHITSIMKLILLLWKKEGATTTLLRHVSSAASVFKNSHLLGRIICRVCYIYQLFWNRFCHLHINKSSIIANSLRKIIFTKLSTCRWFMP